MGILYERGRKVGGGEGGKRGERKCKEAKVK